ncbi:hypothetical protein BLM15_07690 [Bosea sp. Tri-49]|nr:hypothetical protein BLM15_07690 [Bosea sp. Tri-49]
MIRETSTNHSLRPLRVETQGRPVIFLGMGMPLPADHLDAVGAAEALRLFRKERLDTTDIAFRLECTPAAAAEGLSSAREQERKRAA